MQLFGTLLIAVGLVLWGCAAQETKPTETVHLATKPPVPVTVDVSQLPDGEHIIHAKDGNRIYARVQQQAITGVRLRDTGDRNVPIHTIKRLSRDGKTYVTENTERFPQRPGGEVGIAPPLVPGDCAALYAGAEGWWLCVTAPATPVTPPPPPPTESLPIQ
jgi:hypothetical protein